MFDFHIFFCYAGTCMFVIYVDNISHFGLLACFGEIKKLVVFCCAL